MDRNAGRASAPQAVKSGAKANWLTDGGDNQRTAWQKNETRITTDTVKNMKLLWKVQLDNQPRQMHSLFPPLLVNDVTTAQGPKDIAVVAGVSDNVYGIDIGTGRGSGRASSTARSSSSRAAVAVAFSVPAGSPRRQ